jgi:CheY-like chemotaxis protein/HAMP domain-containing protein
MMRSTDISLRNKMFLIVGTALLFQVINALAGFYYLNKNQHHLEAVVDREAEAIKLAVRINSRFRELVISEKNMIITRSGDDRSSYVNAFEQDRRDLEERLDKLRQVIDPGAKGELGGFEAAYRDYLTTHRRIRELVRTNQMDEAARFSTGTARDYRNRARTALNRLVDQLEASLARRKSESQAAVRISIFAIATLLGVMLVVLSALALVVIRSLASRLDRLVEATHAIAGGNLDTPMEATGRDEVGKLAASIQEMQAALRQDRGQVMRQNWIREGQARLNDRMRGDKTMESLVGDIVTALAEHIGAQVGALFLAQDHGLKLLGRYAYRKHDRVPEQFAWGEGLVGQAAADQKPLFIDDVPADYVLVGSALGQSAPRNIVAMPLLFENRVEGVVELAALQPFAEDCREFLDRVAESIAITLQAARARERLRHLLEETRRQAEALQVQQEELESANEELEEQTQRLEASEDRLKVQQEELQATNEALEERNEMLEVQRRRAEQAHRDLEAQAAELALASTYKSQFLANMSHELRSPLNSLLLLSQSLAENREGNLNDDQVAAAKVILTSGTDLLALINDILDLSKIEAGRIDLHIDTAQVAEMAEGISRSFRHVAEAKGLTLAVRVAAAAPATIKTDIRRCEQIIRNLVANAIKFTETGGVAVTFEPPAPGCDLSRSGLDPARALGIGVRDTGIGIAAEDHQMIFEAFRQVDGGTSRKHGGTGLGLSIARQLADLLGGELQVASAPDKGSVFTLFLPIEGRRPAKTVHAPPPAGQPALVAEARVPASIPDDRQNLAPGDRVILVIEDDPPFAKVLCDTCHARGLKCLAAPTGEAGLALAADHLPDGIILDIRLPGMDGWTLLGALKDDIRTRHIPVHVISVEEAATESLRKGAIAHATKPLSREALEQAFTRIEEIAARQNRRVLIVEDDAVVRRKVKQLIGDGDVQVDEAATGDQALAALRDTHYDCLVLDLRLPDMDGGALLKRAEDQGLALPPVIVHTARDLTEQEERDLRERAESIVIKDVRSQERLLDEVSLFLHRTLKDMPEGKARMIRDLHEADSLLKDKKVLVVDDDLRATFAIARLLAQRGLRPLKAESGERALRLLDQEPEMDLVLMDVMMPGMDGYETMRRIRAQERFRKLPIIALTAKAMPGDRNKCIEAGACDYLPKPVEPERLVSMLRVWLYR